MKQCLNCDYPVEGRFCSACGQAIDTQEIDFKFVISEIPRGFFAWDKGYLHTARALILNPAETLYGYLQGRRMNHFSPLSFLLLNVTIFFVVRSLRELFGLDLSVESRASVLGVKYLLVILLTISPLMAYSFWSIFRKSGLNYWQYFICQLYITGQMIFYIIICHLILFMFPEALNSIWLEASVFFLIVGWMISYHYQFQKKIISSKYLIIKVLLAYFLGITMSFISTGFLLSEIFPELSAK